MGQVNSFLEIPGPFEDFDMDALKVDEAFLTVESQLDTPLFLYGASKDCFECPYQQLWGSAPIAPNSNSSALTVSSRFGWDLVLAANDTTYLEPQELLQEDNPSFVCELKDVSLGEFGVYNLLVNDKECDFSTRKEPVFIYGGLIIAVVVYFCLAVLVALLPLLLKKLNNTGLASCFRGTTHESQENFHLGGTEGEKPAKPAGKPRVKSLDTFRGLSIALMIFVNYSGGKYWFMEHSTWDGLFVADLVFPWFLWIMGVCIPMGQRSALKRNVPKLKIFYRIFKRSLKLFMLGIILNSLGGWIVLAQYRVPGILQRFAICYLVVASVALFLPEVKVPESKVCKMISDVISLAWQWLFHIIFVAIHIIIMFCLPVPGCPTGYIGPGGVDLLDSEGNIYPECIGGATGYVDRWLVGVQHLYQNPTAKVTYSSGPFDPEGVLGSMLSIFQVFLGLVAGNVLHHHTSANQRIVRWLVWAVICGAIGTILCFAGVDGAPMPLNKNLWSLSYVMVTSCFAFFLLAIFYLLIDKLHIWDGSPLYQAGMNSIFLYVGHNVMYNTFPWHYIIGAMRTHVILLTECLWGTSLWIITGLYLHSIGKFYVV